MATSAAESASAVHRLLSPSTADKAAPSVSLNTPTVTGLRSPTRSARNTDSDAGSIQSLSTESMYEFEVVYENQRGMFVFGVPKFSAKMLNTLDPPAWSDAQYRFTSSNLDSYQLPNPSWEWAQPEWTIDMSYDVDEEGWEYAFNFWNARWHGAFEMLRSFVRRRRWIRLRRRKTNTEHGASAGQVTRPRSRAPPTPAALLTPAGTPAGTISATTAGGLLTASALNGPSASTSGFQHGRWLADARRMRIDREKLEYFTAQLVDSAQCGNWMTIGMAVQFLGLLDYSTSRRRAVELMYRHMPTPLDWTPDRSTLAFYTDRASFSTHR